MIAGRPVLLRRADDVDAAAEDVAADADAPALPVDDGVLGRRDELQDSVPGRTRAELEVVRRGNPDFVHSPHVDVDPACGTKSWRYVISSACRHVE